MNLSDIKISKMNIDDLNIIKNNLLTDFDNFWTFDILKNELESKNSLYFVAKLNDEIIGFAGIKIILDECELMNIVTKKSYRKNGIGNLLLNSIINEARKLKLIKINLEVSNTNLTAINLYEKTGFTKVGLRNKYYNNENSAILMSLNLCN